MPIYSVKLKLGQSTKSQSAVPIPGLTLEIPAGVGELALIILNAMVRAEGNKYPGAWVGFTANGVRVGAADFTTALAEPANGAEIRTLTAVGAIELQPQPQTVQAIWLAYNGATASTASGSLSAVL